MKKVFSIALLFAVFVLSLTGQTPPPQPPAPPSAEATAQTLPVAINARSPQTLNLKIEVTADTFKVDYLFKNPNAPQSPSVVGGYVLENGEKQVYKVLAINKGLHGDMFKSKDLTPYDFIVGFYCQNTEWKVSLRAAGKGFDLGNIAVCYGGGGHQNAAGFSVKNFDDLKKILFIS